jgi:hypothetical protein
LYCNSFNDYAVVPCVITWLQKESSVSRSSETLYEKVYALPSVRSIRGQEIYLALIWYGHIETIRDERLAKDEFSKWMLENRLLWKLKKLKKENSRLYDMVPRQEEIQKKPEIGHCV